MINDGFEAKNIVLVNVIIIVLYVCKALRIEAREKAKLKSGGRLKKSE